MMEPLPELKSQDLLELTPVDVQFDAFGNVDPAGQLESSFELTELNIVSLVQMNEFVPISPRGPPARTPIPGPANFTIEVSSKDVNKKKFLYSHKLGRIYVDKDCNFSVSFNWDTKHAQPDMYVRATVVFSDVEQSEKRVERCLQHFHESSGLAQEIAKNVLHSSRDIGTQGVYYCGDVNTADSWYSVLVHFKKTSPEPCTHAYKFTCKSSCASGINRRAIAIIFTLEDQRGIIYGRQKVSVRVCSCLRRDMIRDENDLDNNKRRAPPNKFPNTKKIKLETQDIECNMAVLPQVSVEVNAMVSGLRTMIDNMTNVGRHSPIHGEQYASSIAQLKDFINNIKAPQPK